MLELAEVRGGVFLGSPQCELPPVTLESCELDFW